MVLRRSLWNITRNSGLSLESLRNSDLRNHDSTNIKILPSIHRRNSNQNTEVLEFRDPSLSRC